MPRQRTNGINEMTKDDILNQYAKVAPLTQDDIKPKVSNKALTKSSQYQQDVNRMERMQRKLAKAKEKRAKQLAKDEPIDYQTYYQDIDRFITDSSAMIKSMMKTDPKLSAMGGQQGEYLLNYIEYHKRAITLLAPYNPKANNILEFAKKLKRNYPEFNVKDKNNPFDKINKDKINQYLKDDLYANGESHNSQPTLVKAGEEVEDNDEDVKSAKSFMYRLLHWDWN